MPLRAVSEHPTENAAQTTSTSNITSSILRETTDAFVDVFSQNDQHSRIPSHASNPDLERIQKRYNVLVDLDYKIQERIATATTDQVVTSMSKQLQSEEAWFRNTLQVLESVNAHDDEATIILADAMVNRTRAALQDIAARRAEFEDAMPNHASPDVFEMGA